jgi:epsilon-lactone hydrolase
MESIPIASLAGIKVITVDYRMAPYFKFPAASEDSEAVYREVLRNYKAERVGIFGCSAGGALTAQSIAWYRSKGLPRPGAAGIFCSSPPNSRRGGSNDTSMWGAATGIPWQNSLTLAVQKNVQAGYMSSADPSDPRAYPGVSDDGLSKFPPTLLFTGTRATEMSAAIVAHARFLRLGVDSQIYIQEQGVHGSLLTHKRSPETRDAYIYIAKWFNEKLAK